MLEVPIHDRRLAIEATYEEDFLNQGESETLINDNEDLDDTPEIEMLPDLRANANSAEPHSEAATNNAGSTETEDTSADSMEADFSPLALAVRELFSSDTGDRFRAFEICLDVPLEDHLLFGYRNGHAPVNGRCNFCHHVMI